MPATADTSLSQGILDFIEKWRERPGNLIMILHRVQEEYGYVPREVALRSRRSSTCRSRRSTASSPSTTTSSSRSPVGNQISVCMGTACYLKGGEDLIDELENLLGIGVNAVTDDGEFSVEAVRCVGCCGLAPVLSVNGEVYGKVTKAQLPEISRSTGTSSGALHPGRAAPGPGAERGRPASRAVRVA